MATYGGSKLYNLILPNEKSVVLSVGTSHNNVIRKFPREPEKVKYKQVFKQKYDKYKKLLTE